MQKTQESEELKKVQKKIYPPMVEGDHTFASVSDKISDVTLKKKTPFHWFIGFGIAFLTAQLLLFTVTYLVTTGIGIWGNNVPVGWAFDIINFVWWIGIGHAGTLISAILLLLNQKWRTSINRFAEAMTLFAVACILDAAVSEHDGDVAEFPQSFDVGRFCGFHIRDGFASFLVHGFDSRSRDASRSREK